MILTREEPNAETESLALLLLVLEVQGLNLCPEMRILTEVFVVLSFSPCRFRDTILK